MTRTSNRAPRVLLTGAAGRVGIALRPLLLRAWGALRLTDRVTPADLAPGETFVPAELADLDAVRRAVADVDAVVHLGGCPTEAPWPAILESNLVGAYHLFEAAREAGVGRVVFASTNHVAGFYPRETTIPPEVTVRPDSRYGASKAFGEALGALYADKHGLRVLCVRIGNVGDRPIDRRRLAIWIHPEDLAQLVQLGVEHPALRYEVVWGASDNARGWWDNRRAHALGYAPRHRSEDHAAAVLARPEPADPVADRFQGGGFCALEFDHDPTLAGPQATAPPPQVR